VIVLDTNPRFKSGHCWDIWPPVRRPLKGKSMGHWFTLNPMQSSLLCSTNAKLRPRIFLVGFLAATPCQQDEIQRNVSTTLRQPVFEFKLGFSAFGWRLITAVGLSAVLAAF